MKSTTTCATSSNLRGHPVDLPGGGGREDFFVKKYSAQLFGENKFHQAALKNTVSSPLWTVWAKIISK